MGVNLANGANLILVTCFNARLNTARLRKAEMRGNLEKEDQEKA